MNIENYLKEAKKRNWSPVVSHGTSVAGFWWFGHWFATDRLNGYFYGAYPKGYLDRITALFEEELNGNVLHLFSGTIKGDGIRVFTFDIRKELSPTQVGDAVNLSSFYPASFFDIILADPPYSGNEIKYNTKPVNRKKCLTECSKVLKDGGFLVWLDTMIPVWRNKDGWKYRGNIGVGVSTNHVVRAITILQKTKGGQNED